MNFSEVYYYFMTVPGSTKVGILVTALAYRIRDNEGNIPAGEPIIWSSSGGHMSDSTVPADRNGESPVTFIADEHGKYFFSSTFRHNTHRLLITVES